MDRFGTGRQGCLDDGVGPQVALPRRGRTESDRDVGHLHMGRVGVGIRIDRYDLDAQVAAGPDDAQRDLATVRDEDPRERWTGVVFAHGHRAGGPSDARHSGMLPCFFGGLVSRLSASISSAAINRGRVSDGLITSST